MMNREVLVHCPLDSRAETIAKVFYNQSGTSTRAWFSILRVARTVADLEGRDVIDGHAIAEAVQYRWWAGFGREDSRLD
jgi:magnesium chelatase family protein